jgi:predicted 3-demethylubiquinone-9 3-methyltransferase (glyoxalase superfamily)
VVPADWAEKMTDPDKARVERMTQAMFTMKKLDIAELEAAAGGR